MEKKSELEREEKGFYRIEMPHSKDSEERQLSCQGIFALCKYFFGASFSLRACEWKYRQGKKVATVHEL